MSVPDLDFAVNGAPAALPSPATVATLIANLTDTPKGIAVAVNGEVVPRSAWDATDLHPGDRVEVLTAAQGG